MQKVIEKVLYCKHCKKDTLHYRNKTGVNYLLHLILIILTAGLWIPFFLLSLFGSIELLSNPWICSICGTKYKSKFMVFVDSLITTIIIFITTIFIFGLLNLYGEELTKKGNLWGHILSVSSYVVLLGGFLLIYKYIKKQKRMSSQKNKKNNLKLPVIKLKHSDEDKTTFTLDLPETYDLIYRSEVLELDYEGVQVAKRFLKDILNEKDYSLKIEVDPYDEKNFKVVTKYGVLGYMPKSFLPELEDEELLKNVQAIIKFIRFNIPDHYKGAFAFDLIAPNEIAKNYRFIQQEYLYYFIQTYRRILEVLAYIVKCDGSFNWKEKEIIRRVFQKIENKNFSTQFVEKVIYHIGKPDFKTFQRNVSRLLNDEDFNLDLLEIANEVVATQKKIHPNEQEMLNFLKEKLKQAK